MRAWVILGIGLALTLACSTDEAATESETPHFVIRWKEGQATAEEIEATKLFAIRVYAE